MTDATVREPLPSAQPLLSGHWQLRLLGRVEATNGELLITRFNSQPTAALLACLALHPQRVHAREVLAEMLWPGAPAEAARNRLRQALSTLKRLLEPPGHAGPPVLLADRQGVRINEAALSCDAIAFERSFRQGQHAEARALYCGELMPGFYDDWVQDERQRLAALHDRLAEAAVAAPPAASAAGNAGQDGLGGGPARGQAPMPMPMPMPTPGSPGAGLPPSAAPPLPCYLTRFLGRERECAELQAATAQSRLVTLTGFGGCGKTRLALELARRTPDFEWVAFVPLANCQTAEQVWSQLRISLQLGASVQEPVDQVMQALAPRRGLLVLDNFEHLVASCVGVVETLLARATDLHLLLTSRRVLGLPGEREAPLAPLPLPEAGAVLEDVARNPGAALFIDRARSVRPDFQVTARNHEALSALCRALEGVPLAIELAAARSRAFSLAELHEALARPLALLERTGQRGARMPRQDSLRGAIEWSWRLLDAPQQRFLAALSVFRGGCSVADAQAVCAQPRAREMLESLLGDSLLSAETGSGGAMRFRMLELIRDFLADKLEPVRLRVLRQQHRAHVLTQALGLQARGATALDAEELPNVQQAIRTAVEDGEPSLALTLGFALRGHWDSQGIAPDLLQLLRRAADTVDPRAASLPPACSMLSLLLLAAGDVPSARAMAERALVLARDEPLLRAAALCAWVRVVASGERRFEGLATRLDEAIVLADGHPELLGQAVTLQGVVALGIARDATAAEARFKRAAEHWLDAGRVREARLLRYDRALALMEAGRLADALDQAALCELECEAIGERARRVAAINLQGVVLSRQRRWSAAVQAYSRCAREAWGHHQQYWLAFSLWNHGRNLARLRQPEAAARLMAFSVRHWVQHYAPVDAEDSRYVRVVRRLVQAQLGRAAAARAWAEGEALSLAAAIGLSQQCAAALTAPTIPVAGV